ncbi:MAG: type II toxin-antitoxin system HigB family toxin [Xanthobacteraceae bacterium]
MRIVSRNTLVGFWDKHPETKVPLQRWFKLVRAADWKSMDEVQKALPRAKVLNRERVRFEIAGGNYRLIAAFHFPSRAAYIKFIGTHAEYDEIGPLTVQRSR